LDTIFKNSLLYLKRRVKMRLLDIYWYFKVVKKKLSLE